MTSQLTLKALKAPKVKHKILFAVLLIFDMAFAYVVINYIHVYKTYMYLAVIYCFAFTIFALPAFAPSDLIVNEENLLFQRKQIPLHTIAYYRWVYFPNTEILRKFVGIQFFQRLSTDEVKPLVYTHEGIIESKDRLQLDTLLADRGITKIKNLKEIKETIKQKWKVKLPETYGS